MVMVEERYMPLTLSAPGITDEEFRALCEQYEDFQVEYTAEGELVVMPPTDPETGMQELRIGSQLLLWADASGRGLCTSPSSGYVLPNGARRSPDASWISRDRLRRGDAPEFVIELISPSDRPNRIRAKMLEWIENGVLLGWMLNPRTRTVTIFRPDQAPETRVGVDRVEGEGPVAGFVLDLTLVWEPL